MATRRVCLVFDKIVRPDTLGIHVEKAFRARSDVETIHYAPVDREGSSLLFREWDGLPDADHYLQIDDDIAYPALPTALPASYWCIDVHRMENLCGGGMTRWEKVRGFRHVFSAQKNMAPKLGAEWLPLAYDPEAICPLPDRKKVYDWCFVGTLGRAEQSPSMRRRMEVLERLAVAFPNFYVGSAYGEEMNRIYNESRIIVNVAYGGDLNARMFEAAGSGTPLLSDRVENGEDELFDGVFWYREPDEVVPRMRGALACPEHFLDETGRRSADRALREHAWATRVERILRFWGIGS